MKKRFLITWRNTNLILNEKYIKEKYTYNMITSLLKIHTQSICVYWYFEMSPIQ